MNTIKFSHRYKKLRVAPDDRARLLAVVKIDLGDLPREFLAYDTDDGKFPLPKTGRYLMLMFEGTGGLFTTLRRDFPETKYIYYREMIGESFVFEFPQTK